MKTKRRAPGAATPGTQRKVANFPKSSAPTPDSQAEARERLDEAARKSLKHSQAVMILQRLEQPREAPVTSPKRKLVPLFMRFSDSAFPYYNDMRMIEAKRAAEILTNAGLAVFHWYEGLLYLLKPEVAKRLDSGELRWGFTCHFGDLIQDARFFELPKELATEKTDARNGEILEAFVRERCLGSPSAQWFGYRGYIVPRDTLIAIARAETYGQSEFLESLNLESR